MITNQIIQNTIDDLNSITKVDFVIYDIEYKVKNKQIIIYY